MIPIVKWAGGKRRLLPVLLPRIPSQIGTYFEPFAGGAALFFELAGRSPPPWRHSVLSDWNAELVVTYASVRGECDDVARRLAILEERYLLGTELERAAMFAEVRAIDPTTIGDVERATRFLFLNRTCFNGLYRVNRAGLFNVPHGRYKSPEICNAKKLRDARAALRWTEVFRSDFEDAVGDATAGDFVYFDPPYAPISKTADFTGYSATGFRFEEHARLAALMANLRDRGVRALLSNSDTPKMRELYASAGLVVESIEAPRNIAANGTRASAKELLVRNY